MARVLSFKCEPRMETLESEKASLFEEFEYFFRKYLQMYTPIDLARFKTGSKAANIKIENDINKIHNLKNSGIDDFKRMVQEDPMADNFINRKGYKKKMIEAANAIGVDPAAYYYVYAEESLKSLYDWLIIG